MSDQLYPLLPPAKAGCEWVWNAYQSMPMDSCTDQQFILPTEIRTNGHWKKEDPAVVETGFKFLYYGNLDDNDYKTDGMGYDNGKNGNWLYRKNPHTPAEPETFDILPKLPAGAVWVWDDSSKIPIIDKYSYDGDLHCVKLPTLPTGYKWGRYYLNSDPVIIAYGQTEFTDTDHLSKEEDHNDFGGNVWVLYRKTELPDFVDCPPRPAPENPYITDLITTYQVTQHDIKELYREGYITPDGIENLSQNVIKHYLVPYNIDPEDLESTAELIEVGKVTTNVGGLKVRSKVMHFDLGKITIAGKYKNVYDYINSDIELHLPNSRPIKLNAGYLIDQTIQLDVYTEPMTGASTLIITPDGEPKKILYSGAIDYAIEIPIKTLHNEQIIGSLKELNDVNNVNAPTLVIKRQIPADNIDCYNENYFECGSIANLTGFIKLEDVKLSVEALEIEKDEIRRLLLQGVYLDD